MGDLINLRRARKSRDRDEAATQAAANRARFGQGKAEKRTASDEADRLKRTLDGARRED